MMNRETSEFQVHAGAGCWFLLLFIISAIVIVVFLKSGFTQSNSLSDRIEVLEGRLDELEAR